ncbi:MAG: PIN domain-containing protein [Sulfobacillus sp.]
MENESTSIIRAVCDTSVLVPSGYRKRLQEAAVAGLFTPIWSPWIIGELYRILSWKWTVKHGPSDLEQRRCSKNANQMMLLLEPYWELVSSTPPWPASWPQLTDSFDEPIFATAFRGQAQYVISNNTNDFPPEDAQKRHIWQGIEYMPASVFLRDVLGM